MSKIYFRELMAQIELLQKQPNSLELLSRRRISALLRQLAACKKDKSLSAETSEMEAMEEFKQALRQEIINRGKHHRHSLMLLGSLGLIIFSLLIYYSISSRRDWLESNFIHVIDEADPAKLTQSVERHNNLFNKIIYPDIKQYLEKSRAIIDKESRKLSQCQELLLALEKKKLEISQLNSEQRSIISHLRRMNAATKPHWQIHYDRWERYQKEQRSNNQRDKEKLIERIRQTAPTPYQSGQGFEQDELAIKQEKDIHQERLDFFISTKKLHGLNESSMRMTRQRITQLNRSLNELQRLKNIYQDLQESRNYKDYIYELRLIKAHCYPPAIQASELRSKIPAIHEIYAAINSGSKQLQAQLTQRITKREPSFSSQHPASIKQVELMEELFSNRCLNTALYQLYSPIHRKIWISESYPDTKGQNYIQLRQTELSPYYTLNQAAWERIPTDPHMRITCIDLRRLIDISELRRDRFYRKCYLPQALNRIINYNDSRSPALAKAYIYAQLIKLMKADEQPARMGIPYCPSLRSDARSLKQLENACGINLHSGCWLRHDIRHRRAEAQFIIWFEQRQDRNYSREIQEKLLQSQSADPVYVGYIQADGQANFIREVKDDRALWYFSPSTQKLVLGDKKDIREAGAPPMSPIFSSFAKKSN